MRVITLKNYLRAYINELSYCKSNRIHNLLDEAKEKNPRLCEPLLLYAFLSMDKNRFKSFYEKESALFENIENTITAFEKINNGIDLADVKALNLPIEFVKVIKSYFNYRNRYLNDLHTKGLMKKKIEIIKKEKEVSNYRIYHDLNINQGNFNDFMKNERLNKLSLNKTNEVLRYLENYEINNL